MLTRRTFFKTAGLGAAAVAAASAHFPAELLWAEPPRVPQPGGPILLNANENAYGPFPSVLALGNPFLEANRYPDHHNEALVERLAALYKVGTDQVLTGCGSTEVLRMAATAFTGPGRKLVTALPTFEAPWAYSNVARAEIVRVPLAADFSHDLGAMLKATGPDTGLVYICNPNNPTASLTPRSDLETFIAKLPKDTHVLIDEAYHDFVGTNPDYVSFLDRPMNDNRIIVTRTFSKIYALAGMRCGYAVASKEAAKQMGQFGILDSLNVLVARCALVSLDDAAAHQQAQERNAADRDEFMRQATARKLHVIPSSANFVMFDAGHPVKKVIDHFHKNNVLIGRPFPPMDTYARISLSKSDDMKEFWRVWDLIG
jgi:histidinol-phosphate aminotransferase